MRKLRSRRGETLTETLVAVLIIALSAAILAVMITAATHLANTARAADAAFYGELTAGETGASGVAGEVTVTVDGRGETVDVTVSGGDGALTSYREVGA